MGSHFSYSMTIPESQLAAQPWGRGVVDALLDLSPDPVWLVDSEGLVTAFNRPFARWWTSVAGMAPRARAPLEGATPALRDAQRRVLAGRSMVVDLRLVVDGVEQPYAVHGRPVGLPGDVDAAAFLAREVAETGLGAGEMAVELSLLHLFAGEDDTLAQILIKTLEFLCRSDGWDAGIIWTVDGDALHPEASWFDLPEGGERLASRIDSLRFARGHGAPGRAWAGREMVWIPDVLEESMLQRADFAEAAGLHSIVAVPLVESDRVTGVVEFFTQPVRPLSERSRRTLQRTADALGRLIARRRAEDERRRLLSLVERKGSEWMLTFDSIQLPIILAAADGTIVRLNRAARDLAGLGFEELVGRRIRSLGKEEPWSTLADIVDAVRDSGVACTAQITSGEVLWDVAASLLDQNVDGQRVIIVLRDVTQLARLQDAVRRGEQLAALGELVAGVAHEVKNPIFGMSMTIDLLDERVRDDPESAELADALRKWVERLHGLIEDLLEYGKPWTVELEAGSPAAVLQQAIETCQARASDAGVTIDVPAAGVEATVLMSPRRLVHVFENLITNAIQYSPRGDRVTVSACCDGEAIEYAVRDRGRGFDPADLQRVFQPFFTRRRGGTGLGLSIVQRIVDEHGGIVNAGNHAEGGGEVRVRLPIYRPTT